MSILVTGANGQVGHELVRRAGPLPVTGLTRSQLDICNAQAVQAAIGQHEARIVINAAAYTAVDKAETEPQAAFAVNRDGPATLAAACAAAGIPLLHLSTDYVFDGSKPAPYTEDDPVAPLGTYGASKLAGEDAIRASGCAHLILRVAWVFGAHGNNFVRTMLRLGREREQLRVVADQLGGPTPAAAIADALLQLAGRHLAGETLPNGTWHFAGVPHTSWHGFANAALEAAAARGLLARVPRIDAITSAEYPTPARRPANSRLDSTRAETGLGLDVPDWRAGLASILDEWKSA